MRGSAFRGDLCPAVFQGDGAVEDEPPTRRIRIHAEVAKAFELISRSGLRIAQARLHLAAGQHLQRCGVQICREILAFGYPVFAQEPRSKKSLEELVFWNAFKG